MDDPGNIANKLHQKFTIPKIKRDAGKVCIIRCKPERREYSEILDMLDKGRLNMNCDLKSSWEFSELKLARNTDLEHRFSEKRNEMKELGRNAREMEESYCFLMVPNKLAASIPSRGLSVGNMAFNVLGNPQMGTYLFRHSDVALNFAHRKHLASNVVVIFKVLFGKTRKVPIAKAPLDPTPNFDSHISKQAPVWSDPIEEQANNSLIYIYEYDSNSKPVKTPRQCLPIAFVNAAFKVPKVKVPSVKLPTKPPISTGSDVLSNCTVAHRIGKGKEATVIFQSVRPLLSRPSLKTVPVNVKAQSGSQHVPVNAKVQGGSQHVPVNAKVQSGSQNVPVNAKVQSESQHVPVNAKVQSGSQNVPVNAKVQSESQQVPVNAKAQSGSQHVPVKAKVQSGSQNVPVNAKVQSGSQNVSVNAKVQSKLQHVPALGLLLQHANTVSPIQNPITLPNLNMSSNPWMSLERIFPTSMVITSKSKKDPRLSKKGEQEAEIVVDQSFSRQQKEDEFPVENEDSVITSRDPNDISSNCDDSVLKTSLYLSFEENRFTSENNMVKEQEVNKTDTHLPCLTSTKFNIDGHIQPLDKIPFVEKSDHEEFQMSKISIADKDIDQLITSPKCLPVGLSSPRSDFVDKLTDKSQCSSVKTCEPSGNRPNVFQETNPKGTTLNGHIKICSKDCGSPESTIVKKSSEITSLTESIVSNTVTHDVTHDGDSNERTNYSKNKLGKGKDMKILLTSKKEHDYIHLPSTNSLVEPDIKHIRVLNHSCQPKKLETANILPINPASPKTFEKSITKKSKLEKMGLHLQSENKVELAVEAFAVSSKQTDKCITTNTSAGSIVKKKETSKPGLLLDEFHTASATVNETGETEKGDSDKQLKSQHGENERSEELLLEMNMGFNTQEDFQCKIELENRIDWKGIFGVDKEKAEAMSELRIMQKKLKEPSGLRIFPDMEITVKNYHYLSLANNKNYSAGDMCSSVITKEVNNTFSKDDNFLEEHKNNPLTEKALHCEELVDDQPDLLSPNIKMNKIAQTDETNANPVPFISKKNKSRKFACVKPKPTTNKNKRPNSANNSLGVKRSVRRINKFSQSENNIKVVLGLLSHEIPLCKSKCISKRLDRAILHLQKAHKRVQKSLRLEAKSGKRHHSMHMHATSAVNGVPAQDSLLSPGDATLKKKIPPLPLQKTILDKENALPVFILPKFTSTKKELPTEKCGKSVSKGTFHKKLHDRKYNSCQKTRKPSKNKKHVISENTQQEEKIQMPTHAITLNSEQSMMFLEKLPQILQKASETDDLKCLHEYKSLCRNMLPSFIKLFEEKQKCFWENVVVDRKVLYFHQKACLKNYLKPQAIESFLELQMMMETTQFIENQICFIEGRPRYRSLLWYDKSLYTELLMEEAGFQQQSLLYTAFQEKLNHSPIETLESHCGELSELLKQMYENNSSYYMYLKYKRELKECEDVLKHGCDYSKFLLSVPFTCGAHLGDTIDDLIVLQKSTLDIINRFIFLAKFDPGKKEHALCLLEMISAKINIIQSSVSTSIQLSLFGIEHLVFDAAKMMARKEWKKRENHKMIAPTKEILGQINSAALSKLHKGFKISVKETWVAPNRNLDHKEMFFVGKIIDQAQCSEPCLLQKLIFDCQNHLDSQLKCFQILQECDTDMALIRHSNVLELAQKCDLLTTLIKSEAVEAFIELAMTSETLHFLNCLLASRKKQETKRGLLWYDATLFSDLLDIQEKLASFLPEHMMSNTTDIIDNTISALKSELEVISTCSDSVNYSYAFQIMTRELSELSELKAYFSDSKAMNAYIHLPPCVVSLHYGTATTELDFNYRQFSDFLEKLMSAPKKDLGKMAHTMKIMKTIELTKQLADISLFDLLTCQIQQNRKKVNDTPSNKSQNNYKILTVKSSKKRKCEKLVSLKKEGLRTSEMSPGNQEEKTASTSSCRTPPKMPQQEFCSPSKKHCMKASIQNDSNGTTRRKYRKQGSEESSKNIHKSKPSPSLYKSSPLLLAEATEKSLDSSDSSSAFKCKEQLQSTSSDANGQDNDDASASDASSAKVNADSSPERACKSQLSDNNEVVSMDESPIVSDTPEEQNESQENATPDTEVEKNTSSLSSEPPKSSSGWTGQTVTPVSSFFSQFPGANPWQQSLYLWYQNGSNNNAVPQAYHGGGPYNSQSSNPFNQTSLYTVPNSYSNFTSQIPPQMYSASSSFGGSIPYNYSDQSAISSQNGVPYGYNSAMAAGWSWNSWQ